MPTVLNISKNKGPYPGKTLYIGRPKGGEKFHYGNPFSHLPYSKAAVRVATVEEAVARNRSWLKGETDKDLEPERRQWILDNLDKVREAEFLLCFCKPGPCHGDVLNELLQLNVAQATPTPTATPAPATAVAAAEQQQKPKLTVAIIGTAGRKNDANRMYPELFTSMCGKTLEVLGELEATFPEKEISLISGGAAWADHVAVALFLKGRVRSLHLDLPARFEVANKQFYEIRGPRGEEIKDFVANPGGTCNFYHRHFTRKMGRDTLAEIALAIEKGASVTVTPGLKNRNTQVANATALVAMTFGDGPLLKDGGTADTTKKYLDRIQDQQKEDMSYHIDLATLKIYPGAKVEGTAQLEFGRRPNPFSAARCR